MENDRNALLRRVFDKELKSLGTSIYQTIMWYMDSQGIFSNPRSVDIESLYSTLREIVGPHADMIMDMTWVSLEKNYEINDLGKSDQSIDKIKKWLGSAGGAK
jgi:hypothetical protein